MGIYDRDYVFGKKPTQARRWSVNTWIIVINIAVFALQFLVGVVGGYGLPVFITSEVRSDKFEGAKVEPVGPYFRIADSAPAEPRDLHRVSGVPSLQRALVMADTKAPVPGAAYYAVEDPFAALGHFSTFAAIFKLEVWRLITFQFLHSGIMHLAFNMMGLYFFGPMVNQYLGPKRYLAYYLTCGIFGGLTYLLLNVAGYVASTVFHAENVPGLLYNANTTSLVGASAGVFGVIIAGAFISPNTIVQLMFPPIPLRLRTMAYLYVGIAVVTVLFRGHNAGGEAAHIGGAIAGFFLIRNTHLLRDFFDVLSDSRKAPKSPPPVRAASPRMDPADAEVDRILIKVRAEGLQSLSDAEKECLRRASESRRAADAS